MIKYLAYETIKNSCKQRLFWVRKLDVGTNTISPPRGGPWATNSFSEFCQRGSRPAMACAGTNHGLENLMKNYNYISKNSVKGTRDSITR